MSSKYQVLLKAKKDLKEEAKKDKRVEAAERILNDLFNKGDDWFMDYSSVTALHNEAIKNVHDEFLSLKKRIAELESKLEENGLNT